MSKSPHHGGKTTHPDRAAETPTFWVSPGEWAGLLRAPLLGGASRKLGILPTGNESVVIERPGGGRIGVELLRETRGDGENALKIDTLRLIRLSGRHSDVWHLAAQLAETHQIIPFDDVGEVLGERLAAGLEGHPQKFTSAPLAVDADPADVFMALARQGLRCWQINLRGALAYGDPEFFHQLRVTLRRLGTLLKLFKPILPRAFELRWKAALKDVARHCEDIRDLDVMLENILEPMLAGDAAYPPATPAKATREAIRRCREARQQALDVFTDLRHGPAMLAFIKDLGSLALEPGKANRLSIADFTEKRIEKIYARSVERLNATRKGVTAENSHALRISLKHLRYACEFFAPLFEERAMQKYARQIALLQDELGAAHDLHVAVERLDALAAGKPGMRGIGEIAARWHGGSRLPPLRQVVSRVEDQLTTCLPWCGQCKRRHSGKYHRHEA